MYPKACGCGFLVHAYADQVRDRLYLVGRLTDGRSFAAAETRWRPSFHIYQTDIPQCVPRLGGLSYEIEEPVLKAFSGTRELALLRFSRYRDRTEVWKRLEQAGIPSPDGDSKAADAFLAERGIRLYLAIRGESRPGRLVDVVFPDAEILPDQGVPGDFPLGIASIDIETDTQDGSIRAIAAVFADSQTLYAPGFAAGDSQKAQSRVRVLAPALAGTGDGAATGLNGEGEALIFHEDEASLLRSFIEDIRRGDPDVLTGWNFLDFDFPCLARRCEVLGIPFALGRSAEEAKYFAGDNRGDSHNDSQGYRPYRPYRPDSRGYRRRSAAALVPGRQVLDALRIVRSGPKPVQAAGAPAYAYGAYTLEAIAQAVLGEGKLITFGAAFGAKSGVGATEAGDTIAGGRAEGQDKIAELDRLYREDPVRFGRYCYRDAELVLMILGKTGLFHLTMERASLTGVFLDKAWTSVVSFERIYGMELRKRAIAPPSAEVERRVSGAAGGTVLEPLPGFFANVGVFDFRSLYPTIMRTFNIDPRAHARAQDTEPVIEAPNGARFCREGGVLPALIGEYFAARSQALERGDASAVHVYKILMNSFYGVLGTPACRYGRTELAGAITSFARKWLLLSRDWFSRRGRRVLYGDTDSLFVETGLGDDADYRAFHAWGEEWAAELNRFLAERIREEYDLPSYLEMRFEKPYRRFLIPPLRGSTGLQGEVRGRAKGYGGYLLGEDGSVRVEVKGMEAVRSDVTPLCRRLQLELLELVFSGAAEGELRATVLGVLTDLHSGKLDGELIYRKRLSRPPEGYTASTPPQVKAARALGWKGRRGTVEFFWTVAGPEPASLPHAPLDYDHYRDSQILPLARSIASALGWHTDLVPPKGWENGQMELELT